ALEQGAQDLAAGRRLAVADRVERNVVLPLEAPFHVPVGLAVTHEIEQRLRHVSRQSSASRARWGGLDRRTPLTLWHGRVGPFNRARDNRRRNSAGGAGVLTAEDRAFTRVG